MPVNCSVYGCTANSNKCRGLSFHMFPKNIELRKEWIVQLRHGKVPSQNARVCSRHFNEDDYITPLLHNGGFKNRYLKSDVVPSQNLPTSSDLSRPARATFNRNLSLVQRNKRKHNRNAVKAIIHTEDGIEHEACLNAEKSVKTYSRPFSKRLHEWRSQEQISSSTLESTAANSFATSQSAVDLPTRIKEEPENSLEIPMKEEILSDCEVDFDSGAEQQLDQEEEADQTPPPILLTPKQEVEDSSYEEEDIKPPLAVFIQSTKYEEESSSSEEDSFAHINTAAAGCMSTGKHVQTSGAKRCSKVQNGSDDKEQQVCAKFCFLLSNSPAETFTKLKKAFRDDVVSETQVSLWFDLFKKGKL